MEVWLVNDDVSEDRSFAEGPVAVDNDDGGLLGRYSSKSSSFRGCSKVTIRSSNFFILRNISGGTTRIDGGDDRLSGEG